MSLLNINAIIKHLFLLISTLIIITSCSDEDPNDPNNGSDEPSTYNVTYLSSGAESGTVPTDTRKYLDGEQVIVLGNLGNLSKSSEFFSGWTNSSGTIFAPGDFFFIGNSDVELSVVWDSVPSYFITYNANGGNNPPNDTSSYTNNATVTVLAPGSMVREGYTFLNWNTEANGSGTSYSASASFTITGSDITLYAQWQSLNVTLSDGDTLSGTYPSGVTVTIPANITVKMEGTVIFTNSSTLIINEGAIINASSSITTMLIMDKGSEINVNGNSTSPVIFTSDSSTPGHGDWVGIYIVGDAPNLKGKTPIEIHPAITYGGSGSSSQSSGEINYLKIFYAGANISAFSSGNGISFNGVGSGTIVNHLQVHKSADDGIEIKGGTVNLNNVIVTGCQGDQIDWSDGWSGTIDNGVAATIDATSSSAFAMEGEDPGMATFKNMTIIGDNSSDDAIVRIRDGETQTWQNCYFAYNANGSSSSIFYIKGLNNNLTFNNCYAEGASDKTRPLNSGDVEEMYRNDSDDATSANTTISDSGLSVNNSVTITINGNSIDSASLSDLSSASSTSVFNAPFSADSAGTGADYSEFSLWVSFP